MNATHSRRRILFGLGAACAAATAAPAIGQAAPAENPALIALGDALPEVLQAYLDARAKEAQTVAQWSPQWPTPSPEIIRHGDGCKPYRAIDGWGLEMSYTPGGRAIHASLGTPEVFKAEWLDAQAEAEARAATKGRRGLKDALAWAESRRAAIATSQAYWAEVDRVTVASDIEAVQAAHTAAREALRTHVGAIMATDETTIAGVVIKAQALTAWGQVEGFFLVFNPDAPKWAEGLAASIMRQGGVVA